VKQHQQGDDPRPIWRPEISEREGGGLRWRGNEISFSPQIGFETKKIKMKKQNKNSLPRQLVVPLL
jgi:hypothetical protein